MLLYRGTKIESSIRWLRNRPSTQAVPEAWIKPLLEMTVTPRTKEGLLSKRQFPLGSIRRSPVAIISSKMGPKTANNLRILLNSKLWIKGDTQTQIAPQVMVPIYQFHHDLTETAQVNSTKGRKTKRTAGTTLVKELTKYRLRRINRSRCRTWTHNGRTMALSLVVKTRTSCQKRTREIIQTFKIFTEVREINLTFKTVTRDSCLSTLTSTLTEIIWMKS